MRHIGSAVALVLVATLSACSQDADSEETGAVITVTATPSPSPSPSVTAAASATPEAEPSVSPLPKQLGPFTAPTRAGVSVVAVHWAPGDAVVGGGLGTVLFFNNGPDLFGVDAYFDVLDSQGNVVSNARSSDVGPMAPGSFGIGQVASIGAIGENLRVATIDAVRGGDIKTGASVVTEMPSSPGAGFPVTITNFETKRSVSAQDTLRFAFLGLDNEILGVGDAFLPRPVPPGQTVESIADALTMDVPPGTVDVVAVVRWNDGF